MRKFEHIFRGGELANVVCSQITQQQQQKFWSPLLALRLVPAHVQIDVPVPVSAPPDLQSFVITIALFAILKKRFS